MNRQFREYLQEDRWSNDPMKVYSDVGELAEDIKEYYFNALDSLDRLKLGYSEDEEQLRKYADTVKTNVDKMLDIYLNSEDHNKKDWSVANKPWK